MPSLDRHAPAALLQRRQLLGAGLACCLPACAAPQMNALPALASSPAVALPLTHQIDITAAGRARRVFVAIPHGPAPAEGHPVLWTLDGNAAFPLLAALMRQREARPTDLPRPVPVVIGIGLPTDQPYDQAARAEDYTLPAAGAPAQPARADAFLDMIETQLQPWLAQQLRVDPMRQTLFGHSFGGLLTLYALFTRPQLFQRWLAASPSIWWGERAILPFRDAYPRRASGGAGGQRLVVTAGSLEEGQPHANPERVRRQAQRRQVGSARDLVASLSGVPGLQSTFRLLEGEDHGSLVLPSALMALDLAAETP